MVEFKKFTDFSRGTMYGILQDAYDERNKKIWDSSWKESDDFFYDNPEISEKYGLITCIDEEALRRIKEYESLKRIIVCTNSNLVAPKNYESVGFRLYDRKPNATESAYTGDYLYYEIVL